MSFSYAIAIARRLGPNFAEGLTTAGLGAPDVALAIQQHAAVVQALRDAGLEVLTLKPEPKYPDACFVEDTAVVLPGIAVIARPGAPERRGEERSIEPVLERFRPIARIETPGTLDGGDVLVAGPHVFIGLSDRTNVEGAHQLGAIVSDQGLAWSTIDVGAALHLKSCVNAAGPDTLLVTQDFVGHAALRRYRHVLVDDDEAYAANSLWLGDRVLMPGGFPKTRRALDGLGLPVIELEVSEFQKMDGGLTCLSLRF